MNGNLKFTTGWFLVAIVIAGFVAFHAWRDPKPYWAMVDISSSVLAIFVGVSLAIFTVLASKPSVRPAEYADADEVDRIETALAESDQNLVAQQYLLFSIYFIAIILGLITKFFAVQLTSYQVVPTHLKPITSAFVFFTCFSFMMSIYLPRVAAAIVKQRRDFG